MVYKCSICNCELKVDEEIEDFYELIDQLDGASFVCESCKSDLNGE